ncbi:MAG: DUF2905 domain-containing protein [Candidatus Margulisiibacteriota bacterium]
MIYIAKMMMIFGSGIFVLGLTLLILTKIPFFGKLPGDILIQNEDMAFFFPLTTMILISIAISVIINLLNRK